MPNIIVTHPRLVMSSMWRDVTALQHLGHTGCLVIMGNGQNTVFWTDIWASACALMSTYYHLYQLCIMPHITMYEVVMSVVQALQFRTLSMLCNLVGSNMIFFA
jgi:hypothetical protein